VNEDYIVIDLRKLIGNFAGLTDADRAAMYKKYRIDELGPYRRWTREQAAKFQKICDKQWQRQVSQN
jgi:hypothetical protein